MTTTYTVNLAAKGFKSDMTVEGEFKNNHVLKEGE